MTALYIKEFPDDLHKELKILAAENGTSLKAVVIDFLWKQVKEQSANIGLKRR